MKEFLKVKDLCFSYLKRPLCLKDVNFSAAKDDNILILGLDDRGKTTLLKTLSGFEERFFGKVFLDGKEIRSIADNEKNVSLILDYPVLVKGTIDDNLEFLLNALNRDMLSLAEKKKLLEKFNLNHDLDVKVKKLSLFEQFKLCFLRTFIKQPSVLFIDDILKNPFSEEQREELGEILKDLSRDRLLVFSANEKSFVSNQEIFKKFSWSKVLYLNNAKLSEKKDLNEFLNSPIDLDSCLFSNSFIYHEGYCIRQDGAYYLNIDEKFVIKIDKQFDVKFDKLKLSDLENEDIVVVFDSKLHVDFNKNNDFNKLINNGNAMIFSKLDRSRII